MESIDFGMTSAETPSRRLSSSPAAAAEYIAEVYSCGHRLQSEPGTSFTGLGDDHQSKGPVESTFAAFLDEFLPAFDFDATGVAPRHHLEDEDSAPLFEGTCHIMSGGPCDLTYETSTAHLHNCGLIRPTELCDSYGPNQDFEARSWFQYDEGTTDASSNALNLTPQSDADEFLPYPKSFDDGDDTMDFIDDLDFGEDFTDVPPTQDSASSRMSDSDEKKKHFCTRCGKAFKYPKDVQRHEKSRHSAERPYRCMIKGCKYYAKGFPRKDALTRHLKTHIAGQD